MDDRTSFEEWARARQHTLVRAAFLVTGDFHRAEDLVQEALVKAAARWGSLRGENPDAWVRTVVYRDHVSWWRRLRHETSSTQLPDRVSPGPDERSIVVRDALARLTHAQRAVLVLRYLEDLSVREAAAVLGVTEGTVKKQTSIALIRLRETSPELEHLMEELA